MRPWTLLGADCSQTSPLLLRIPLRKCYFFSTTKSGKIFGDQTKSHFRRGILSKSRYSGHLAADGAIEMILAAAVSKADRLDRLSCELSLSNVWYHTGTSIGFNRFCIDCTLPRVFGHNSLPRTLTGTRIGGNGSYQLPGAP